MDVDQCSRTTSSSTLFHRWKRSPSIARRQSHTSPAPCLLQPRQQSRLEDTPLSAATPNERYTRSRVPSMNNLAPGSSLARRPWLERLRHPDLKTRTEALNYLIPGSMSEQVVSIANGIERRDKESEEILGVLLSFFNNPFYHHGVRNRRYAPNALNMSPVELDATLTDCKTPFLIHGRAI